VNKKFFVHITIYVLPLLSIHPFIIPRHAIALRLEQQPMLLFFAVSRITYACTHICTYKRITYVLYICMYVCMYVRCDVTSSVHHKVCKTRPNSRALASWVLLLFRKRTYLRILVILCILRLSRFVYVSRRFSAAS